MTSDSAAHAQAQVASFLSIPVDAASAGAGGADVARPGDGISPFANPAAAVTGRSSVDLTHGVWLASQSVDALAIRFPLERGRGGLAITGRMVNHASIPRFDDGGARLSSLDPSDLSVGVAYGVRFGRMALGAGAHYVQENLDIAKGTGYAYDLGMLVDIGPLRVGAAGTSLLGQLDYDGESYDIPQRFSFGASFRPPYRGVELDLSYSDAELSGGEMGMGVHWTALPGILILRAGYVAATGDAARDSFSPMRFGFRIGRGSLALDYAYVPHDELGQAHLFALRWSGR